MQTLRVIASYFVFGFTSSLEALKLCIVKVVSIGRSENSPH